MARLTIRQLSPRDLPAMRHVQQHVAEVATAGTVASSRGSLDRALCAFVPGDHDRIKVFVALVEGELCAYAATRPDREQFAWRIVQLAAGSPRLDAHESEVIELWCGLLEFIVARAGDSAAKRLFAACEDGSTAHASLARAGFEGYAKHAHLVGEHSDRPDCRLSGVRDQEPSDVWSIHNLYHRVTPRPVQFAEARTSGSWDLPRRSRLGRIPMAGRAAHAYVYETLGGIEAYCRVERTGEGARIDVLADPVTALDTGSFVREALCRSEVPAGEIVRTAIPGYALELVSGLERAGFRFLEERVAMVRHTTVHAAVHLRLAPLPAVDAAERAVRGIPTYSCWPEPDALSRDGMRSRLSREHSPGVAQRLMADRTIRGAALHRSEQRVT